MSGSRLRIVVSGLIAQYPLGGVTWDYLQYVVGLARLGHDVYYVEDSGQWPYNALERGQGRNAAHNIAYLAAIMTRFGLGDRWAYRFPGGTLPDGVVLPAAWSGMSEARRTAVLESAELLVNVSSGIGDPEPYHEVPRRAYVDTDPVFTQIRLLSEPAFRQQVDAHDLHFSYGELLRESGPHTGHDWRPMRKPILLDQWRPTAAHRDAFTTVMNWTSYGDVVHEGRCYGQKDAEFLHFADLPRHARDTIFEVAIGGGITRRAPLEWLHERGWRLVDPAAVCPDLDGYRIYIETSAAEWTVAKQGYVLGAAGWFSGRSACYLAAGRPVVVQDTGFASVIPTGAGVLAFRTLEQAVEAVREVVADYGRHARAARAVAEDCFDSAKVLGGLVEAATVSRAATGGSTRA